MNEFTAIVKAVVWLSNHIKQSAINREIVLVSDDEELKSIAASSSTAVLSIRYF